MYNSVILYNFNFIKKQLNSIRVYLILFILIHSACKKEDNHEQKSSNLPHEYVFTVGIDRGVTIVKFDTPIQIKDETGFSSSYVLDLNQDQVDDIIITSEEKRMSADLDYQTAMISILNNDSISFSTTFYSDSAYKCLKKVNGSLVDEYWYFKSECSCSSTLNDTTYEIGLRSLSSFYTPNIYTLGEVFQPTTWYSNTDFTLAYNQSKRYNPSTNSITYCYVNEHWNNISNKYVIFKYKAGTNTKYGWIKLSVSNYYQVLLHEFAIEN